MTSNMTSLASALHHLADLLIEREVTDDVAAAAVHVINDLRRTFELGAERSLADRSAHFVSQMSVHGDTEKIEHGETFASFTESPYSGTQNALAPREVTYRRLDDTVEATIVLGTALEGRPGRAHGGAVAAVFDDVMGALQHVIQRNGYTRTLHTTYAAPFPTDREVTLVAECVEVDGDRFTIDATATADGRVVATARGVFTEIDIDRWQRD